MLKAYAAEGFVDLRNLRTQLEALVARGAFRSRTIDMAECETFVHGDQALVKPVTYNTMDGPRHFSFHLAKERDGKWRIIDSNRSLPRDARYYTPELVANAGKVVGVRGLVWIRRLDVPVEDVWAAISTKEGLEKWFLTRSVEIDLRPGGLFRHHWTNTVLDYRVNEYIDFIGSPDDKSDADNLMRFELKPDGDGTVFSLLDAFNRARYPLSQPWTASGWHGTVDSLEAALTGREIRTDFGLGGEFYWGYLRDFHKLADMTERLKAPDMTADSWRQAYLTQPL
jgi:uncharacterized protein YndB with AHSA1/START domain